LLLDLPELPVKGHNFAGYYFTYPSEEKHQGLVSTISVDPPMLNWIYVHKDTHALLYGGRKDTLEHVIGPWGWTEDERFLTLQGDHETFVAMREQPDSTEGDSGGKDAASAGRWGVYWDPEGKLADEAGPDECRPVMLRRKLILGVESKFVK
jgi:hypothetical protein